MQVALGGAQAAVAQALAHDLEVGAASEQPRGVRVPQSRAGGPESPARAPDLVKRDFPVGQLNRKWFADGTQIVTR